MSIQPHDTGLRDTTPRHRRGSRHPEVAHTEDHHALLKAADLGSVVFLGDRLHVLGFRVHADVVVTMAELLIGGCVAFGDPGESGRSPVLLTRLGAGVLARWDREHPGAATWCTPWQVVDTEGGDQS